jgi:uncharacterized damage-inducible protein DinB
MPRNRKKSPKQTRTNKKSTTKNTQTPAFDDRALRAHLAKNLDADTAHVDFDKVINGWPEATRGAKPAGSPHSAWQLLEHMRLGQWDILEFVVNPKHVSPPWPSGYWPATDAPPTKEAWEKSIKNFRSDLQAMRDLISNPKTDLFAKIPHGTGQIILRQALLLADHNSHHLGQLVLLRRLLGAWPSQ